MNSAKTVIHPALYDHAFPNSLKGQRGCILPKQTYIPQPDDKYVRLVKSYFYWNELEQTKKDDEERIRQVTDKRFAGCEAQNIRFIPRIVIHWPNHGDSTKATRITSHCASDMSHSTLDTPEFLSRVYNLIEKAGAVWDLDPRIAYIESGIYGLWGEQHEDSMSRKAQENLSEAFHKFFPNTPCMVRYPKDCIGQGFGSYWDSFAHIDEQEDAIDTLRFMDWRTSVMGGEVAHNWGRYQLQPGDDMNDTLTSPDHKERFLDYVYWQHNNHLGIQLLTDARTKAAFSGLSEYQKRAGHRFVLNQVAYEINDNILSVSVNVVNQGASPLYHNWPLAVGLLDKKRNLIWQSCFKNTDLRKWLPGEEFDFGCHTYKVPAKENHIHDSFPINQIPKGTYILALSILDPSCGLPNILFATRQYFNGGWHPIGLLGIATQVDNPILPDNIFDNPSNDTAIHY